VGKPLVRLYPLDIERLPWVPLDDGGVHARLLARDPESGSQTRIVRAAAGARVPSAHPDAWEELFLFAGTAELDGRTYGPGSYLCLPPGTRDGALTGVGDGVEALRLEDHHSARMDKPHVRLTSDEVDAVEPEPAVAGVGGWQRPLAAGPSGSHTRLLAVQPHDDSGVLVHDFTEEGIILAGSYKMSWQLGEEFHPAGTYTHLPAHVYHGPCLNNEGFRAFEVRNYA
jgi:hypothetical protein